MGSAAGVAVVEVNGPKAAVRQPCRPVKLAFMQFCRCPRGQTACVQCLQAAQQVFLPPKPEWGGYKAMCVQCGRRVNAMERVCHPRVQTGSNHRDPPAKRKPVPEWAKSPPGRNKGVCREGPGTREVQSVLGSCHTRTQMEAAEESGGWDHASATECQEAKNATSQT